MKEELQGKLVEILTSIQTAAGKASDFAMAELPDIAQSYIAYGRASTAAYLALAIAMLIFAAWCYPRFLEAVKEDAPQKGVPAVFGMALGGLLGLVMFASHLGAALLVWTAPKVWLLKEIAGMLK
jgi:hypothetical protein